MSMTANTHIRATGLFSDSGDIELRGDSAALLRIAELFAGKMGPHVRVSLRPPQAPPVPYDGFLLFLSIEIQSSVGVLVKISREGDTLRVVGSGDMMSILADNVRFLVDDAKRSDAKEKHLHVEYHPDHYYLANSSQPLVLVVAQE